MIIGYARTSTTDQTAGLEAQLAELGKVGVKRVFSEQISAVAERKALEDARLLSRGRYVRRRKARSART
jgi:DNA invertase Pin-like site-specific DNA recombinase